jgi:hypothetical protein
MDEATSNALSVILTAILGTGGIASVIAAVKAWRTRHTAPHAEQAAVAQVGADWDALNKYWKAEVARIRAEQTADRREWNLERHGYRATIRGLRQYVDQLEAHIWLRLPPPPPKEENNEGTDK